MDNEANKEQVWAVTNKRRGARRSWWGQSTNTERFKHQVKPKQGKLEYYNQGVKQSTAQKYTE